jgi:SAM-dependent methyltransferase
MPPRHLGHPLLAPALAERTEGFEAHYLDDLARLEDSYFWFRARNRLIAWALERYFPDARTFFEIGCGTGQVLADLAATCPRLTLAGSEVLSRGIEHARRRAPGAMLVQMDALDMPFVAEFDVVAALDVLEHVADDRRVLAGMRAAVRPGGGAILTVPQHPRLWSASDDYARHQRRYTRRELVDKVHDARFRVVRATSFVSLLLPLLVAARLLQRRRGHRYDPLDEYRIPRVVNGVLGGCMLAERAAIRAGVNWPAGGSLLLVARAA